MRICYLASAGTLPGSPLRRGDAFEHDQMIECLRGAFRQVEEIAWDDEEVDWARYDAAIIGTTWDYQDRLDEFLATLDRIASRTRLRNPAEIVKWNSKKTYLRDLESKGVRTISTLWLDQVTEDKARRAFETLGSEVLVFKRQVGASSEGQHRLEATSDIPRMSQPMLVQPFLEAIRTEGELSFIFIGGEFSHAVRKKPAKGDYRIQSLYGGTEEGLVPGRADLDAAAAVIDAVDGSLLYARVDMLRDEEGRLSLIELELVEPFLYPLQGPELGRKICSALVT